MATVCDVAAEVPQNVSIDLMGLIRDRLRDKKVLLDFPVFDSIGRNLSEERLCVDYASCMLHYLLNGKMDGPKKIQKNLGGYQRKSCTATTCLK